MAEIKSTNYSERFSAIWEIWAWSIEERHEEIAAIHLEIFGQLNRVRDIGACTEAGAMSHLNDDELLKLAISASNGTATERLYKGDTSWYSSHSEADLALCSRLAFFAGRDIGRIDRLFRASGLFRPKWDRPTGSSTYGDITIRRTLDNMKDFSNSEEDCFDSQQPTAVFETTQTAGGVNLHCYRTSWLNHRRNTNSSGPTHCQHKGCRSWPPSQE